MNLPSHATRAGGPLVAPPADGALKRILLIDDEAHVLRVMRLSLDRNGYEVDTALGGEVALRLLCERRYAVLIVTEELATGKQGFRDCVRRRFGDAAPLMLIMAEAGSAATGTGSGGFEGAARLGAGPAGIEWIERPVSLRWIVARLNEYFGDYDVG